MKMLQTSIGIDILEIRWHQACFSFMMGILKEVKLVSTKKQNT